MRLWTGEGVGDEVEEILQDKVEVPIQSAGGKTTTVNLKAQTPEVVAEICRPGAECGRDLKLPFRLCSLRTATVFRPYQVLALLQAAKRESLRALWWEQADLLVDKGGFPEQICFHTG